MMFATVPGADRAAVGLALRSSFAAALNELLYVTAGLPSSARCSRRR